MIDRIKELAAQTGAATMYFDSEGSHYAFQPELLAFAEALIRDCAAQVDDLTGYDESNNTYPADGEMLLEHYGITK